ncbi:MAG: antibiotic biosynthesis monooxygenase family protein [Gammaproteobacteria bacterium]
MILEAVIRDLKPGRAAEYEAAFERGQHIVAAMPGYVSHELGRCLERDDRYLLLIRWDSLEAHTEGFRGSPGYAEWKALLHEFYDPFPVVEHYVTRFEGRR